VELRRKRTWRRSLPIELGLRMGSPMKRNYDVALTFAGEDRATVAPIAKGLKAAGFSVFFDEFEVGDLWGRNLVDYLHELYSSRARYCVIFVSESYLRKPWTNLERRAAQARAFTKADEAYILPIRIDGSSLPGMADTVGHIDIAVGPALICDLLSKKLGRPLADGDA
jgi:hypothetical protein